MRHGAGLVDAAPVGLVDPARQPFKVLGTQAPGLTEGLQRLDHPESVQAPRLEFLTPAGDRPGAELRLVKVRKVVPPPRVLDPRTCPKPRRRIVCPSRSPSR